MRRRELLGALTSAAAWPILARAQQSPTLVVGFIRSTSRSPFENLVSAFQGGLNEAGFIEGQNVTIAYRYGDDQVDRLQMLIAELIRQPVLRRSPNKRSVVCARLPARGARAAGRDPGNRAFAHHAGRTVHRPRRSFAPGVGRRRIRRGPQCRTRAAIRRQPARPAASSGGRPCAAAGLRDRRQCRRGGRSAGRHHDDPDRLRHRRRPGQDRARGEF